MNDGTTPNASLVPLDPRKRLELPVGMNAQLPILVLLPSGAPVKLAGMTLTLTVKKRPTDGVAFPAVTATIPSPAQPGMAVFSILGVKTKGLNPGTYLYDVWISDGSGNSQAVVPASPLVFTPSIN